MLSEQMRQNLNTVMLLEKDLMRDLTEQEIDVVNQKGFKALFDKISIDDDDYKLIKVLRNLLGEYLTGTEESYKKAVEVVNEEQADLIKQIFENIFDDIVLRRNGKKEPEPEVPVCKQTDQETTCKMNHYCNCMKQYEVTRNSIETHIAQLKAGEELELDQKEIDEIVDRLMETESQVHIQVVNNKIKLL